MDTNTTTGTTIAILIQVHANLNQKNVVIHTSQSTGFLTFK